MKDEGKINEKEIIEGKFGESVLGTNIKGFISKVGERFFFGYYVIGEGRIFEVKEVGNLAEAIEKLMDETYFWGRTIE